MIKFVMCLHRRPDMTREQFQDYWMNKHGPFFMRNADDMRAKKYVQSLTVDTPLNEGLRNSRGMLPEYDGVAEVWFESEEDLVEAMSSPEGQKLSAGYWKMRGILLITLNLRHSSLRSMSFKQLRKGSPAPPETSRTSRTANPSKRISHLTVCNIRPPIIFR